MQAGLLKLIGKLGIYMGIPSTALLSMLVMRFINQSSVTHLQAPGAVLPDNKIELKTNRSTNLLRMSNELDGTANEESTKRKLISLDFPAGNLFGTKNQHSSAVKDSSGVEPSRTEEHRINSAGNEPLKTPVNRSVHRVFSRKGAGAGVASMESASPVSRDQSSAGFNDYSLAEGSLNTAPVLDAENTASHQSRQALEVHALVLGDQKIRQGSVIKFRTEGAFILNTHKIKPNTVFYAYARFDNERLQLYVNKMGTGTMQQALHLVCRDEDDKEGIALHSGHGKWAEPAQAGKDAAVDELSSRVPVGGGIVSQLGHKLFQPGREEVTLNDGIEVNFVETAQ